MIKELKEVRETLGFIARKYEDPEYGEGIPDYFEINIKQTIAKLDGVIKRLESSELVKNVGDCISGLAKIYMAVDADKKPILYNAPCIAQAAINVILDKREV